MNEQRKKTIASIVHELNILREELQNVYDDEQDAYDSMAGAEVAIAVMEDQLESLQVVIDELENIK